MKARTWLEVKTAANICLVKMNRKLASLEDPVLTVFGNNLPIAMKEIAVHAFMNGKEVFGPELLDIRNGLDQLQEKGFIGEGKAD
jgi:hypothetical protein